MSYHLALPLALATFTGQPSATDGLPYEEFDKRFEQVESLLLEYRVLSASGDIAEIRVAYESPHHVHLEMDTGDQQVDMWNDGDASTWLVKSAGGQQAWAIDFENTFSPAQNWHWDFMEDVLGKDVKRLSHVTTTLKIWPSIEADTSWTFDLSSGVSSGRGRGLTLDWLEQMQGLETEATHTAEGWSVELESGARLVLDPDLGHLLHAVIDPSDPAMGELSLVRAEIDLDLPDDEFDAEIPDGIELTDVQQASICTAFWVQQRTLSLMGLAHLEGDARREALASASFEELMGTYYRERFADELARAEARMGEFAEERARLIQEFLEENGSSDRARAEATGAARQLRGAFPMWGADVGREIAKAGTSMPDDPDLTLEPEALEEIVVREEEVALEAIGAQLVEALTARVDKVFGDLGKND